jgi:hypothetical protein
MDVGGIIAGLQCGAGSVLNLIIDAKYVFHFIKNQLMHLFQNTLSHSH